MFACGGGGKLLLSFCHFCRGLGWKNHSFGQSDILDATFEGRFVFVISLLVFGGPPNNSLGFQLATLLTRLPASCNAIRPNHASSDKGPNPIAKSTSSATVPLGAAGLRIGL